MKKAASWTVTATVYPGATLAGTWSAVFTRKREAIEAANKADGLREAARLSAVNRQYPWLNVTDYRPTFTTKGWGHVTDRRPRVSVSCPYGATTLTRHAGI